MAYGLVVNILLIPMKYHLSPICDEHRQIANIYANSTADLQRSLNIKLV